MRRCRSRRTKRGLQVAAATAPALVEEGERLLPVRRAQEVVVGHLGERQEQVERSWATLSELKSYLLGLSSMKE